MCEKTVFLTYRYRLLPLKCQHVHWSAYARHSGELYNAALEERIDCLS